MMVAHCINLIYFSTTVSQILSYFLRECWSVQVIVKVDQLNGSGDSILLPLQELICGLQDISGTINPLPLKIANFITNNVKSKLWKKSERSYLRLSQCKLQPLLVYLKSSIVRTVSAQMTLKFLHTHCHIKLENCILRFQSQSVG